MTPITVHEIARELGLSRDSSTDSYLSDRRGVAKLIRQSIYRRGVVTRRELAADWRPIFESFGEQYASIRDRFNEVADSLSALGDLIEVSVGREHGWAKGAARWLSLADDHAVALGAIQLGFVDAATRSTPSLSIQDVPRRFDPRSPDAKELVRHVEVISFQEWLGDPGWLAHWKRRGGEATDTPSLQELWHLLLSQLRVSDITSDDDDSVRVLGGEPGRYFGRHYTESREGRWMNAKDLPDGDFLAARQGFQETDWRFLLVEVRQRKIGRVLQLEDSDEFRWSVLARGLSNDEEEQATLRDCEVQLTFPPPNQVARVLNLYGWLEKGWTWHLASSLSSERFCFWRSWRPFA